MRAVLMTMAGGPDVLKLGNLPEPELSGAQDARAQLKAAGINPVDYKMRSGGTIEGSLPAVLGWDGAGVVESIRGGAGTPVSSAGELDTRSRAAPQVRAR